MAVLAERHLTNLRVEMVYRTDRYGRGGNQVPFLEAGFPAVPSIPAALAMSVGRARLDSGISLP